MKDALHSAWEEFLRPMILRPKRVQVAALCYRPVQDGPDGAREILLITSRGTGRWILPKGWPIDGKTGSESALQEAWEEAGVTAADIDPDPIGQYGYDKRLDSGGVTAVETQVYLTRVRKLTNIYPEAHQRSRRWVTPQKAASMVDETGLRDIMHAL